MVITCITIFIICGKFLLTPLIKFCNISIPALVTTGSACNIPCPSDAKILPPAVTNLGNVVSINVGTFSNITGNSLSIKFPIPLSTISILGRIFLPNALALDTKSFILFSKVSTLSSAILVSTFFHAALVIFKEPCIVSIASFAVVPVIPKLS